MKHLRKFNERKNDISYILDISSLNRKIMQFMKKYSDEIPGKSNIDYYNSGTEKDPNYVIFIEGLEISLALLFGTKYSNYSFGRIQMGPFEIPSIFIPYNIDEDLFIILCRNQKSFIHELTHLNDYILHKDKNLQNSTSKRINKGMGAYFNDEYEMNAHFMENAISVISMLNSGNYTMEGFEDFMVFMSMGLKGNGNYLSLLSDKNLKRFKKRCYLLYSKIKDNIDLLKKV